MADYRQPRPRNAARSVHMNNQQPPPARGMGDAQRADAPRGYAARPPERPQNAPYNRQSAQRGGRGNGVPPRKRARHRAATLVLLLLMIGVLCVGSVFFVIYRGVNSQANVFCEGVYVAGVHLGGMTQQQAFDTLSAMEQDQIGGWHVVMRYQDTQAPTMTAADIDLRRDLTSQLADAWKKGHEGSMIQRWREINALRQQPYISDAGTSYSAEKLEAILQKIQARFDVAPVNASSSYVADAGYQFQGEQTGSFLDIEPVREQIVQSIQTLSSVDIQLQPTMLDPQVTVAQLQGESGLIVAVESTISKDSTEGRDANIQIALGKIDGIRLTPNEKFSFNGVVGKREDPRNGFQMAKEIVYGEYRDGIGGGVCQVSTALYQAALRAGLKIEVRKPHGLPVNYAELGQDATVADSGQDFVFRNNTGADIHIRAYIRQENNKAKTKHVVIEIYGKPLPDGIRYALETEKLRDIVPDPEYQEIRDKDQEYVQYIGQSRKVTKPVTGYEVRTYLVTIDKNGNRSRSAEPISHDTYPEKPGKMYVGVLPRD